MSNVNPVDSLDGNTADHGRGSSRAGTTLVDTGRKAAVYGFRHLLHNFDYHLLRGLAAPDKVALVLTNRCNCRCVMCDLWRTGDAGNELPAERWIALLDELHAWTRTLRVRFVGGEVLLKPGVYDIIRRAVHLGFTVNVISNGLALQSERNYRDLMNTGLRSHHLLGRRQGSGHSRPSSRNSRAPQRGNRSNSPH